MTSVWMGLTTVQAAADQGRVRAEGDRRLAQAMEAWLGLSPFAGEKKRAAG
jgi:hypothetical protein